MLFLILLFGGGLLALLSGLGNAAKGANFARMVVSINRRCNAWHPGVDEITIHSYSEMGALVSGHCAGGTLMFVQNQAELYAAVKRISAAVNRYGREYHRHV